MERRAREGLDRQVMQGAHGVANKSLYLCNIQTVNRSSNFKHHEDSESLAQHQVRIP
jgi:ribosome modulation factor